MWLALTGGTVWWDGEQGGTEAVHQGRAAAVQQIGAEAVQRVAAAGRQRYPIKQLV